MQPQLIQTLIKGIRNLDCPRIGFITISTNTHLRLVIVKRVRQRSAVLARGLELDHVTLYPRRAFRVVDIKKDTDNISGLQCGGNADRDIITTIKSDGGTSLLGTGDSVNALRHRGNSDSENGNDNK